MSPEQRRYFVTRAVVGAVVINALLNGGIGWLITLKKQVLPMWGMESVGFDTVAMAFGVTFGTCVGATWQARRDVARGFVEPPVVTPAMQAWMQRLPTAILPRSILTGVLSVVAFAPFGLVPLMLVGMGSMGAGAFILYKTVFASLQAAIITPLLLVAAVVAPGPRVEQAPAE